MDNSVFLTRVVLRNYKSIAACSVELGPLTFLVGPNGAGKSNFLDALRLLSESLTTTLEHALRERGGIGEVRRRSSGHPNNFGIRLEFKTDDGATGWFSFSVGAMQKGGFEVQEEQCHVFGQGVNEHRYYHTKEGELLEHSEAVMPPIAPDRLTLVTAGALPGFREAYELLSRMGFYNLNPDKIRELQPSDTGFLLRRDGENIASVLNLMENDNKNAHTKVMDYLSKVVPGIKGVTVEHMGKKETLVFRQFVGKNKDPWRFLAENMSDGTLRALGVLTALYQSFGEGGNRVPFVGIEEPEIAVHPGAAGVIRGALQAASANVQVAVTSHSPDLLDDTSIDDAWILGVENVNGETKIGTIGNDDRSAIHDRLYTTGELLRMYSLRPDMEKISQISPEQLDLFAEKLP